MTLTRSQRMSIIAWAVILFIIIADQWLKIWIKTNFYLNEDYEIFSWFHIHFIQNNGMAFGLELFSKYVLTFFRIGLFGFLVWYLWRLCQSARVPYGYLVCISMIAAGAFGNIIDCVFYGEIFTNPYAPAVAQFVPWGEGYGNLFQGLVVDMFYFPLFSFNWPEWIPFVGGERFSFFDPVFNVADAAISVGIFTLIIFYYNRLETSFDGKDKSANKTEEAPTDSCIR